MEKTHDFVLACLSDWLNCLRDIKSHQDNMEYDLQKIRLALIKAIEQFARKAEQWLSGQEAIMEAQYAMTALADEYVISTQAGQRSHWLSNPLQLQLFGDIHAGEHFFELLAELRLNAEKNAAVLEIYLLCLELGYRGQYLFQDEFHLKKLKAEIHQQRMSIKNQRDPGTGLMPELTPATAHRESSLISEKIALLAVGTLLVLTLTLSLSSFFRARFSEDVLARAGHSILKQYQHEQGKQS